MKKTINWIFAILLFFLPYIHLELVLADPVPLGPWHIEDIELKNLFNTREDYEALYDAAQAQGHDYVEFFPCAGGCYECGGSVPYNKFERIIGYPCNPGLIQAVWNWYCDETLDCPGSDYITQYKTSEGMFRVVVPLDTDKDGVPDFMDNCVYDINPWQSDFNLDGEGDVCDDEKPDIRAAEFGDRVCMGSPNYRPHHPHIDNQQFQGNPINIYNGNKVETTTDIAFQSAFEGGLVFKRSYNSQKRWALAIGNGWRHNFHFSLYRNLYNDPNQLEVKAGTGQSHYFEYVDGENYFRGKFLELSKITNDPEGNYVWNRENGTRIVFDITTGLPISITDANGNIQSLTYNDNYYLEAVTDQASGRTLTFHYNADNKISHITGPVTPAVPDGIWASYDYDGNDNLIRVTYSDDDNGSPASGVEYRYEDPNDPNNLTSKYDLAGNFIASWSYDTEDRAYENITRDGKGVTIDYTNPEAVAVTDAYGVTSTYTTTSINLRQKITTTDQTNGCGSCADGIRQTDYDPMTGNPTQREWFNGMVIQYLDYDANHNTQTLIIDPGTTDEETIRKTFHSVLNTPLTITEKSLLADAGNPDRQKVTIYDYDDPDNAADTDAPNEAPTNRVHRLIRRGYTHDAAGAVIPFEEITAYQYNARGQVTNMDGPLPGTDDAVILDYDPVNGDLLTITSPLIGDTSFEYDAAGNPVRILDVNGVETVIAYDGRQRPTSVTVDGHSSTTAYTAAGEIDMVTDRAGLTLDYAYDLKGLLERITQPSGAYLSYGYDTNGNLTRESAHRADDTRTRYQGYDYGDPATNPDLAPGKPWKLLSRNPEDTADLETILAYTHGLISGITDPNGHWQSLLHDTRGRLTRTEADQTDTQTAITQFGHDWGSNLTRVTDPKGNTTDYTYDDADRLVMQVSPDTGTTRFSYDVAGRLATRTLADGITTTYTYDTLNRQTGIIYADVSRNVTYTYDEGPQGKGRLSGISDPSGAYAYVYNRLGQLLSEEKTAGAVTDTTAYTWDPAGKRLTLTYPSGRIIRYERRADGTLQRVVSEMGAVTTVLADEIAHLPFGPLEALTYGYGRTLSQSFDLSYRPAAILHSGLTEHRYVPDGVGNVAQITDALALADELFSYDGIYQLTSAAGRYTPIDYTHDAVGNRETRTQDQTVATYIYTALSNRLEYITGLTAAAGPGIRSIDYNPEGRISRISDDGVELATYTYNSKGQRTTKTVSGGATTRYHYDLDGRLIAESTPTGAPMREYVYLDSQPLAMIDYASGSAAVYFYHNDHLGTPKALTNMAGTVVWQAWHTPFGKATITVNTVENHLRYAGQYYDGETGLHYNWHRSYDPKTGRYLTPDPIGLAGGNNLYAYVQNNPVNFVDPLGLYICQMPPAPPGYDPNTWGTRVNPNGRWEVNDPHTGKRWVAHPEDKGHWRHWDDPDHKGPDKRWPRKSKKKWPGQKRKAYGEQSECDPSGDEADWHPTIDEFSTLDPLGRIVPIDQPIFIFPNPHTSMPPVFLPRLAPVPAF